ncbi:L-dopachrome tautomerase-related protein [Halomonas sp. HNIBRBA4712]|uniref:L-dopachrome tautomerase-related protein n=1 Tax=Halomonas sp. HNIBRBA4712 TaxID=3373087 RepID=UPI003744DBDE
MQGFRFERRELLAGAGFFMMAAMAAPAQAFTPEDVTDELEVVARSPEFLANAVTLDGRGTIFLGMPRWHGMEDSPAVARVTEEGDVEAFPGNQWNEWDGSGDPAEAFVQVNTVHVFADDWLWVVDQGDDADEGETRPGQKVLAFDPQSGELVKRIDFDDTILPPGAEMNDLRVDGSRIYITDSGLGGIIVHDLQTGDSYRRLSEHPELQQRPGREQVGTDGRVFVDGDGEKPTVHSDQIEVSADGLWFYWAMPTGPFSRIPTAALWDDSLSEEERAEQIETVAEIPPIGGSAIDSLGNLYLSNAEERRIDVLTPEGDILPLAHNERLNSPDAIFIDARRRLYVPAPQLEDLPQHNGGEDALSAPFEIFAIQLPDELDGHELGGAVASPMPQNGH